MTFTGRVALLRLVVVLCGCAGALLAAPSVAWAEDRPTPAPATGSSAERQARGEAAAKAFVLGQYEEALAIYLDLYVQSGGRPEYLRNIGRCQQKLKRYDRAIDAFKDYLNRAKRLSADEKREIEGYIAEMEAAANSGAAPAASPAPNGPAASSPSAAAPVPAVAPIPAPPSANVPPLPAPTAVPPATSAPVTAVPAPGDATAPSASSTSMVAVPPPAPVALTPTDSGGSSRMRVVGVVVMVAAAALAIGGTAALLSARSTFKEGEQAGCKMTGGTLCEGKATEVETANAISKALYVGAGLAGTAGVLLLVLAPPANPEPSTRAGLGLEARWSF